MGIYNYEYGTTPRKLKPDYDVNKKKKEKAEKQAKINEKQKKDAMKLEKKKHNQNVALVLAIFLLLLTVSYRSSLINEKFKSIQNAKQQLASIEKTNGQLEVSIESSLNLNNVEQSARDKLGMQKLDNSQKVFVTLDKKDYVEAGSQNSEDSDDSDSSWLKKFFDNVKLILGKK